MSIAIITGSAGLIGSEAVAHFASIGMDVVGIDNGMRASFFGPEASTQWVRDNLCRSIPSYRHHDLDIRDAEGIAKIFETYAKEIALVIHTAAQPSHDWAANDPHTDFTVNANGTLEHARSDPTLRSERRVYLHVHQQSLRRHAEPPAAGRAGDALGDRPGASLCQARHPRDDVDRPHACTACSARRKLPPTCWCRNTAATSA